MSIQSIESARELGIQILAQVSGASTVDGLLAVLMVAHDLLEQILEECGPRMPQDVRGSFCALQAHILQHIQGAIRSAAERGWKASRQEALD